MEHKDPEVSVWSLAADSLVLNVDGGGLNRDQIMSKVAQEAEKSRALHRQTATAAEFNEREFEIAYRDSINRYGLFGEKIVHILTNKPFTLWLQRWV